ncbi:ExbD/TolR family protein [Microcoleus sp. FACHB-672]|uniref:ExbD/TolR family protein n=1 Tax=Microcoleus sp. FACHB-672 TaxID=2692825 RepID=UPI0016820041|nr:biopolymer transporter ExbD [Microcoleus sp. FACHB-672]MBD2041540.1 biopolymer transporter ExbD [Microcoleus sp. FACHB-672]
MKINLDSPSEEARIEIVPLIDVIFCILTFFILAALQLTRQQAITVDLPKASTGQPQIRQMLIVGLDPFGQAYIDQRRVNPDQLSQELLAYSSNNPEGLMVLYASKEAKYNDVVQVLDQMREVGGSRVALATLPGSESEPVNPNLLTPVNPTIPGLSPSPKVTPSVPLSPLGTPAPGTTFNPNQLQLPGVPAAPGAGDPNPALQN